MELVARLKSLATDSWRRPLVVLASVVLVVLTGWTLARLVWLVIEGPPRPVVSPPDVVQVAPQRQYTAEQARQWLLFGDAGAAPGTASDQGAAAPDTRLSLQLLGTFSTRDAKLAGAVIAERGRDGELFRLGAAVPGGATLEKVEGDRVLLRRRGQLETLRFDVQPAGSAGSGDEPAAAAGGIDTLGGFRNVRERLNQPPPATDAPASGRETLERIQEDLRSNPEGVLDELGFKPAPAGAGYVVGTGTNAEAARSLGLRPGDVVLSVNGNPLGEIRRDAQLFDQVKASGEARVEIRRGSQTFTVNYPL